MSQDVFSTIDPAISGSDLAATLNAFKDALMSGLSGTTRPTELQPGGFWVDTTDDPTTWSFRLYTGTDDVEVFKIDVTSGGAGVSLAVDSFTIRKVSDDDVGAVLDIVKRRIATSGQVKSGDVVGEIRITGRTDSATNPVVAKIIYTADEDQTATAFGGTLSFYSTPEGSATLTEHLRFLNGIIESVVPHKINAQELVAQSVATTATIAQLDASKTVVEMTGSTATDIQGINSAQATKQITIHNRSSAIVTLKHQSTGAAAADRLLLPTSQDIAINPQESVSLIYSDADSRWKSQYRVSKFGGFTVKTLWGRGSVSIGSSPVFGSMKAVTTSVVMPELSAAVGITDDGSAYAWGDNSSAALGTGDLVSRSSPVAVVGGLKFKKVVHSGGWAHGITEDGTMYSWGANSVGRLGVGDSVTRSSPVAVLGGLKFASAYQSRSAFSFGYGITTDRKMYAWGANTGGKLGVGDTTSRSSPVLVLGGLVWRDMVVLSASAIGIATDGSAYGWGNNPKGQLGLGDVTMRSSPVAVLGGLKFKKVITGGESVLGITDNGSVYGWGSNSFGELGVGDVTNRSSPVAVLGGLTFKDIFGYGSNFGIQEDGTVYGWGINLGGALGVGDTTNRSSPVLMLGGIKFKKIISPLTGGFFGLAEDGSMYTCGSNPEGRLGVGDTTDRSSPTLVLGGHTFRDFATSGYSTIAVDTSGVVYAWGDNSGGQLGVGDLVNRSSPVAVLGGLAFPGLAVPLGGISMEVTPGTITYSLGDGPCYFNNKYIGKDISELTISYAN